MKPDRSAAYRLMSLALLPWLATCGLPLAAAPVTGAAAAPPAAAEAAQGATGAAAAATTQEAPASSASQQQESAPAPPVIQAITPAPSARPAGPAGTPPTSPAQPPTPPTTPAQPGVGAAAAVQGQRIAALEFKGLKTLSEETMLYYLGLEVGQPIDQDRLNKNIKTLWDRGLVDDLKVDYTPVANGVKLTISVAERPILRSIDYQGLKRISKTDVEDKIATQRIHVHEGEPLSLGELQRIKTLIEDLYREKGYRFAQARYTVQDLAGNDKKVVFTVDEGDRVRIAKIEFTGNTVFHPMRLRFAMKDTKQSNLVWRILKKDVYDPAKVQEDLDKVRDLYHSEGYKNVAIGEPKIDVRVENPGATAVKDQKRRMFITIPIEEGDRWRLGQISLEGNKIYPDVALMRAFAGDKPGVWLRSKLIDDGIKKITDSYHNTGYVFARVEPELVERGSRVADLVVHINEGDQFKVGRIEFSGNDRTQDKVLRREVRLFEGGLVNIAAVKNSVTKINQLGYFKLDEEDPVDIDTNSEKKEVNLLFKGREANRTELQFGGGWSELDGFFVQFSISTKNFLGRGENAGISVQTGRFRKLYDLTYNIPWWLDKPQSIGFRAFDSNLDYTNLNTAYIQNAKGVSVTYGKNLTLFSSASLTYTYSKHTDSENLVTPVTNGAIGVINEGVPQLYFINTSSIKPAFTYDSRDNPFEPVHGFKFATSLEYGGGPLGGNDNFLRPDIGASIFVPVTKQGLKTVFAFNAEAGYLYPTTKVPLSPLEFFFLGGENSVRGFRFRSITVRDSHGNPIFDVFDAGVGGDKYLQFNAEYHFLVGGPFRILLFSDAGNVYGRFTENTGKTIDQNFDLGQLRYTAGVELRVIIPVFGAPLRFIYSKNLHPLPFDEFETFQFSIGTSF
jgi:outer membrane protein insertion porin family